MMSIVIEAGSERVKEKKTTTKLMYHKLIQFIYNNLKYYSRHSNKEQNIYLSTALILTINVPQ